MLWGQKIRIFTDHKNLMRDALGMTSDRVYRWRLLLKEYAPEIVYIKGIHNTVADAISRLDYDPMCEPRHAFMQCLFDEDTRSDSVSKLDYDPSIKPQIRHSYLQTLADDEGVEVNHLVGLLLIVSTRVTSMTPKTMTQTLHHEQSDSCLQVVESRSRKKSSL